jgi:hypothetical protein
MEVYLSPVYRDLAAHYQSTGIEVGSFTKEMDLLMKFLTAPARAKGIKLAEFEQ